MKGEAIDSVNEISKSCQPLRGKTGLNTNDKGTCLMRERKARKKREKTHPGDSSLSVSNPTRALDTLSGYHGRKGNDAAVTLLQADCISYRNIGVRTKSKARGTYYCMIVQTKKISVQIEGS